MTNHILMSSGVHQLLRCHALWLTVFRFPAYAPELNPTEGVCANLKGRLEVNGQTADDVAYWLAGARPT